MLRTARLVVEAIDVKRSRNHHNGDRAVLRVIDFIQRSGAAVQSVDGNVDYGIDLHVQMPERMSRWPLYQDISSWKMSGRYIHVQVKYHGGEVGECPSIKKRHLENWVSSSVPTFLAVAYGMETTAEDSAFDLAVRWAFPNELDDAYEALSTSGKNETGIIELHQMNFVDFARFADLESRFPHDRILSAHCKSMLEEDNRANLKFRLLCVEHLATKHDLEMPFSLLDEFDHEQQESLSSNFFSSGSGEDSFVLDDPGQLLLDLAVTSNYPGGLENPFVFAQHWKDYHESKNDRAAGFRWSPQGTEFKKLDSHDLQLNVDTAGS